MGGMERGRCWCTCQVVKLFLHTPSLNKS
ncbi:hypothetical protein Ahy_A06g030323 isoform C [Arachis hypogaea]|uniref:Uncharacterized protein n=1 Tax=Arachis hypogaea TaxID=3818 RepID=A0A445CW22_ARAHY|nr:hypothetical protein Ahy_B06g085470 isoform C [Arachis hypogaea]RYR55071.1 hypothetical protein Ahy_A06g030323 isoform C [Arachis hypogaea]